MESFDQSLKYLLQHQPADFIRFGLGDAAVEIRGPVPSDLPSRGRDVDGGYVIVRHGTRLVAHVEFHRRHQSLEELAIDVAEAQIRLYRRERSPVLSQVWDLYGEPDKPVLAERTLPYGAPHGSARSQCVYQRVNLRGLRWQELLSHGAAALWPLVTLTRDGASEPVVRRAHDAIEGRAELGSSEQADYLAVLWFVAEAEGIPAQVMRAYMTEERLMESTLYRSIFEKGEAQGEARGEARGKAQGEAQSKVETIIRVLAHRLGFLDPAVRERIRALSNVETLTAWYEEALLAVDAESARRLVEKIQKAPLA